MRKATAAKKQKSTRQKFILWKFGFRAALAAVLAVGVNGPGIFAIGEALAYYLDTEVSPENAYVAGEVDFALDAFAFTPKRTAISLSPQDITRKDIDVHAQDSNPFKYAVSTENVTGDTDFCEALNVEAELEGVLMYDADLVSMLTSATSTLDSWEFTIGMGEANFQNKICDFDTQYFGSQTRHDYGLGGGFNDTETEKNTIASWGFRINKVYYDVASDRGKEGANEWVEIYNQTNVPLDINGWELCDNTGCDVLSATEDIPAMGYGFITASSTTASNVLPAFWYLPEEVVEVGIPDTKIGNGLSNDSDMLALKRPDGVIVDQMNWGDPNEAWPNWNEGVWDPGAVDVAEGNALARVLSGYDTNQPSDFTELVPPSVDLIYPDEAESYVWYWGFSYTIEWTAVNNNGNDEDLDMSIFFIRDINGDIEISDGDIMFTIAETTANDGEFTWTVPSGFLGYIWIYVVATGPENPMWNAGTISGDIYDPAPLFVRPLYIDDLVTEESNEGEIPVAEEAVEEEEDPSADETGDQDTTEESGDETGSEENGDGLADEEPAADDSAETQEDPVGDSTEAGEGEESPSDEEPAVEEEPNIEESQDAVETQEDSGSSDETITEEPAEPTEPVDEPVVEEETPVIIQEETPDEGADVVVEENNESSE